MSRKIIYLFNPISGTSEKSSLLKLIGEKTSAANIPFELMKTNARGDYSDLRQRVEKENITDIVVCGGDGTVSAVAAFFIGMPVRLGIIPMGSGNGLALAARIPTQPVKALDIIFKGNASWIDGFYVNNQFSCMLCGIGFDAQVATDFANQKTRGLKTYVRVSLMNLFRAKPFPFEVHTDTTNISTEAFFISIANGNQFGNNFTIAPQASLSDGKLDVVIVKKMNKFLLPFSVIAQVTGMNGRQELADYIPKRNIIYFPTESLTIINNKQAPMHIDGDPKQTSLRFEIKVVREAIQLIQAK
jgi:diacylglycerol kinase (ATP)